ncbi:MAG: DUF1698 domain-containing protein [Candidatus Omnitrophica bacterium]|nr:DUF1698 domain-containing protein [Candidatus Omnitrophota bacterium]
MLFRKIDKNLKTKIDALGRWYYYMDFDGIKVRRDLRRDGAGGYNNWNNFLKFCFPDVKEKRILDVGCNAGIYDLEMAKMGASEVIGIDRDIRHALFAKDFFSRKLEKNFENVKFIKKNAREGLGDLGKFDFACLFCVIYHFEERIDFVMEELSKMTDTVVMQGNLIRLASPKYKNRIETKYAGTEGIKELLQRHGFKKIQIFDFGKYPKPVVIGER